MSPIGIRARSRLRRVLGGLIPLAIVASLAPLVLPATAAASTQFTPGDLVVYRVGTGGGGLVNTGNAVFLDEYSPSGTLVQSVPLPTTSTGAQRALFASGTATSEGALSRSADGRFLLLTGYASTATSSLAGTTGTAVPRVVARVDASTAVDSSTALTDFSSGNNPRGATSADGTAVWAVGGAGGVRFATIGATTSNPLTDSTFANARTAAVVGGQLYASTGSGTNTFRGVDTVGTGLPTSGTQTVTRLPGLTDTTNPSTYAITFADLDSGTPGNDVLYTADDSTGALTKFSLVSGNWVSNGTVGSTVDAYRGVTSVVAGSTVTLYATRKGGSGTTGGGELVRLADPSGYNGAFTATPTVLATAANNTAIRGVAFAPGASTSDTRPDLSTTLSAPATAVIGTPFTYTITVANGGASPATGVDATFALPIGITFQSASGAGFSASQTGGTVTFSGGSVGTGATATLTVQVLAAAAGTVTAPAGSVIVDPSGTIDESNEANNASPADVATSVSASSARIHDIQGAAHLSPLRGTGVNAVPGIVTATQSNGFYFQDPSPDADPATSEGIFVFTGSAPSVAVGDAVFVTGTVSEFRPGGATSTNLTTTEISGSPTFTVGSSDNSLPAPTVIGTGGRVPPNTVIEDDAAGNVETSGTFDPATDGIDFYESLEGMRVQVNNARVTGPTARFGTQPTSNAEIYLVPDNGTGASVLTSRGGIIVRPTDFNPERVIIEAANSATPDAAVGDVFPGPITGVVDYDFGNFKLHPTTALPAVAHGFLPKERTTLRSGPGALTVATFNVENLDPTDPQSKFDGLGAAVVANLGSPAIISVEEVQDDNGATNNGVTTAGVTLGKLIAAITAAGGPTYDSREIDPVDGQDGGEPGGNIRQVLLFRPDLVSFVGVPGGTPTSSTSVVTGPDGPSLSASPGRLDPTNPAFTSSRKPLVAEFLFGGGGGAPVFVIANHFNSKGGDDPLFGADQPPVLGSEVQRVQQAIVVKTFLQSLFAADASAKAVVLGDLNDFEFSNPLATLKSSPLVDLDERLAAGDRYTYDFEGNSQVLDHVLVSASLAPVSQVDVVHLNAEYPAANRLSDHDPVVAALNFNPAPAANNDSYSTPEGTALDADAAHGVLANDSGGPLTVVRHTNPSHGTLQLGPDGSLHYAPAAGYAGPDSFTYTASDAVRLFPTAVAPLGTIGGVTITGGAFGSSLTTVPGTTDEFYGLTDRGPNVDGPGGTKIEPIPSFDPAIGQFSIHDGKAVLLATIPLQAPDGTPYSGRVNTQATTGETITDLNGNVLAPDPNGYDPEGIVALADGTFWISDEYGPFITHFDATGRQIGRLSPFDATLPAELANRIPNKGMEGLTVTPDGSTLVGMMQSALQQPDLGSADPKKVTTLRIVTFVLATGEEHEYLYLLDEPSANKTAVSEITALSSTEFLVDERDGNVLPNSYKRLFRIDLTGATDVGPASTVTGATYNAGAGGLLVGGGGAGGGGGSGQTIEKLVAGQGSAASAATLTANGITPVAKQLQVDLAGLLTGLDPTGHFFGHDKVEGVAVTDGGTKLVISNDSDFGVDGITNSSPPFQLHPKITPAGVQDDGELLVVDLTRLPAATTTATVSIDVTLVPASVAVSGGSGQSATVATPFAAPLSVLVTDAEGRPVPGASVDFSAPTSGPTVSLSAPSAVTGADGLASVTATAGTIAGIEQVIASVEGVGSVTFELTNLPGTLDHLEAVSGGGQSATVATAFAAPLVVRAVDAFGNRLSGVEVDVTGPVTGSSAVLSPTSAATGADGTASFTATANTVSGTYAVQASSEGTGPVPFALTNSPGSPAAISYVTGSGQVTAVSTQFASPLVLRVVDAHGNAVPHITVAFQAPKSGASVAPAAGSTLTDNAGLATFLARANRFTGTYTDQATVAGVSGSVPFTLTNALDQSDLTVTLSGPTTLTKPSTVNYTVTVTNHGPLAADQLRVSDTVPNGLNVIGTSPTASGGPHPLRWIGLHLDAGATITFLVTVTVTGAHGSNIGMTASATSKRFDPVPGDNTTSLAIHIN